MRKETKTYLTRNLPRKYHERMKNISEATGLNLELVLNEVIREGLPKVEKRLKNLPWVEGMKKVGNEVKV